MTALETLKRYTHGKKNTDKVEISVLALNRIINALMQEPKEITIEDVKGYCKPRLLTIITNELLYELTHPKIKALSQRPKTGEWIPVYQGDEIINYRCSECEFGNTFGKSTYRMNYCPNCGARMVEPQESEE